MKKIKNKIAALVCGLVLLTGGLVGLNAAEPDLPQRCVEVSYSCCGGSFAGSYDLIDNPLGGIGELILDYIANCGCDFLW
jgi:hypothetical protein